MIVLDAILDLVSERRAAMLVAAALGGLGLGFWLGRRGWGAALAVLALMLAEVGLAFWAASRGSGEWGAAARLPAAGAAGSLACAPGPRYRQGNGCVAAETA